MRPDTELAHEAGLRIGDRGGIAVDEHFRTSDPRVYAVGDAVEKVDSLDHHPTLVPLANSANLQGRRVADVIAGRGGRDRPVRGTAIVGVMGLQVAATGWNEKRLRAAGRAHRAIHTHPSSHTTYYPGAEGMALKLLVDPDTDAILGAQGVGRSGVDKRIDIIATAMAGGLTASALAELELAYAPQFGSAKDPVNMLGHIADNLRAGVSRLIQWHEIAQARDDGARLIDVRTPAEFARGSIPSMSCGRDCPSSRTTPLPSWSTVRSACADTPPPGSWCSMAGPMSATSPAATPPGAPGGRGQQIPLSPNPLRDANTGAHRLWDLQETTRKASG